MKALLAVLIVSFAAAVVVHAAAPPPIVLTVAGSAITASGVTPHGSVYVFGITHEQRRFTPVVTRVEKRLTDDDGDGVARFDFGRSVPLLSVWTAVDLTDGRRASAAPGGEATPLVLRDDPFVANNGQLKHLVLSIRRGHLLIVRPGVGVWGQVLNDGNRYDVDAANDGSMTGDVGLSVGAPGTTVPAPSHFDKGDVVVLIEPLTLQVFTAQVGEKP